MSDEQVTKTELLQRIEAGHSAFEKLLSTLSDEQLTTPGGPDGWSVKDHLAHLASWEAGIAALLRRENRWEAMGLEKDVIAKTENVDQMNTLVYEHFRNRSLAEVRAAFEDAHKQLVKAIKDLTDADLFKTYSSYQPDEPGDEDGRPIWPRIVGNSYEHYVEHEEWIKALLAGKR